MIYNRKIEELESNVVLWWPEQLKNANANTLGQLAQKKTVNFLTASLDGIPDPQNLEVGSRLNGRLMQESNTREMIFPVAKLISFCSHAFTLEAGDVLLTGTPHGVGIGRTPPLFMQDGDEIVVEVEGIGALRNVCRVDGG